MRDLEDGRRTSGKILFIRKDHQETIAHFSICEDTFQLQLCLVDTFPVSRVNDEDETLGSANPFLSIVHASGGEPAAQTKETHLSAGIVVSP